MPVDVQKILRDSYYKQLRNAEAQAELQDEPLEIKHAARFYADPLFWELLLILFLVSLKAWKAGRGMLFCLLIAGIVALSPFIGTLLFALFVKLNFPFDLEVVRLITVLLIAGLFYVYIALSR